jgi:hypothetical protein
MAQCAAEASTFTQCGSRSRRWPLDGGARPKAVQEILGHSTLDLTMRLYARATERAKREAVSALPFATVTQPSHVIAVESAHTVRTGSQKKAQHLTKKRVVS